MAVLPYWDKTTDLSTSEKAFLATLTYLIALAFVGLLFFACYNSYMFLIKPQPRRKLLDPLSMFYLLGILTITFRLCSVIFWF